MVEFNYRGKEANIKIVYYGPGLSGKTTNLQIIHKKVPAKERGKLTSLATQTDRTLFFDFLPIQKGEIHGFKTRFLLYTVPGQVFYNATRKVVLTGVDAIVFVADSQESRLDANLESLQNLRENLIEHNKNLDELSWVIQYNKRDLPNILTVPELQKQLNPTIVPYFEACAITGEGVSETLNGVITLVINTLNIDGISQEDLKKMIPSIVPEKSSLSKSTKTNISELEPESIDINEFPSYNEVSTGITDDLDDINEIADLFDDEFGVPAKIEGLETVEDNKPIFDISAVPSIDDTTDATIISNNKHTLLSTHEQKELPKLKKKLMFPIHLHKTYQI